MIRHAIIQAGGEGTRLRPVTLEIPKPLVPVQGVPIASWLIRLFAKHGVERVTVVYPPKWKGIFTRWVGDGQSLPVELHEEKEPMGTMGALVHDLKFDDEPIFVTNGDELKSFDLSRMLRAHEECKAANPRHAVTLALRNAPDPSHYGVAELDGNRITRFVEKPVDPPSTWVNSGLYIVEPSVFGELDRDRRFQMFEIDLFPHLAAEGRLGASFLEGDWYDCGTLERWEKAIREWRGL